MVKDKRVRSRKVKRKTFKRKTMRRRKTMHRRKTMRRKTMKVSKRRKNILRRKTMKRSKKSSKRKIGGGPFNIGDKVEVVDGANETVHKQAMRHGAAPSMLSEAQQLIKQGTLVAVKTRDLKIYYIQSHTLTEFTGTSTDGQGV
jgi:ATP-dependent 26S proteasome regulatory subunit